MAKTTFIDGDKSQGIMGSKILANFLHKWFGTSGATGHRHTGLDEDGHAPLDFYTDTGAANAYAIQLNNSLPQRVVGMPIQFMAANENTGPSTLNDGFGVIDINKNFDQPLAAGDIKAGQIVLVVWDGANYQMISAAGTVAPIGVIMPFAGVSTPPGWLLCYGQAVSRTIYSDLFQIIGTTYGAGDGSTTFNIPDLRGRSVIGVDSMGGTSANRVTAAEADIIGGAGGSESHTLTTNEMPSHVHAVQITNGITPNPIRFDAYQGNSVGEASTLPTGGGLPHNNMQPYIALNYIIKY